MANKPLEGRSFSAVASGYTSYEYVEIDATSYCDPYNIPKTADICLAITRTFGEDPDRTVFGAGRSRLGMYRIETPNINRYHGARQLKIDDEDSPPFRSRLNNFRCEKMEDCSAKLLGILTIYYLLLRTQINKFLQQRLTMT